jgi:hypothetical protein
MLSLDAFQIDYGVVAAAAALQGVRSRKMSDNKLPRTVLPVPDRDRVGLTTYDAKDSDTKYPSIKRCAVAAGAAADTESNALISARAR